MDDVTDEDLQEQDDDSKKALLLLLLLGNFDFNDKFLPALTDLVKSIAQSSFSQAETEIKALGGNGLPLQTQTEIINNIISDRMAFILPEIERVTKENVSTDTYKATDKNTLKNDIEESYAISIDRVYFIANVENRTITNVVRIAVAKESDIVAAVLVSDGEMFDGNCAEANGQVWSLNHAGSNILEHVRCVRQFTFLTKEQVEELGGIDVE